MIFAAQFLEEEGITKLPPGGLPVGAVERIARIAARQPEMRRKLLAEASEGKVTIRQLKGQLKKSDRVAKRARKVRDDVPLIERAKAELASRGIEDIKNMKEVDILNTQDAWYFDRGTRPSHAIMLPLPYERGAVVLDGTSFQGSVGSFMMRRKEFLRNILIGASLYDYVIVWAPFWHKDVEEFLKTMLPASGGRVVLIENETDEDETGVSAS